MVSLREQALKEIQEEEIREQINKHKERIRSARWWHKVLPFTIKITITRRKQ